MSAPVVKIGQRWQDNDKRAYNRIGTVIEIGQTSQTCRIRWDSGKVSRISLHRMKPTSTGYRLLEDV